MYSGILQCKIHRVYFPPDTRLSNVRIGVSNTSPESQAPTVENQNICATLDAAFGRGETKALSCEATGRYVSVIYEKTDFLMLCEVRVYGSKWSHCKQHYL